MESMGAMAHPVLKANRANPDYPASVDLPDPVERVDLQAARPCW